MTLSLTKFQIREILRDIKILFSAWLTLFLIAGIIVLAQRSCGKKQSDEPVYTKLARMGTGVNVVDTTKNPQQDSLQRLNTFIQKFNDTATITEFRKWMYKNASGENYDNLFNSMTPYLKFYFNSKYQEFLKASHK